MFLFNSPPSKKKNKDTQEVSYCYEFYFIVLATFPESHVDLPAGVQMYQHYYEEKWVTEWDQNNFKREVGR